MANKITYPVHSRNPKIITIAGSFFPNGTDPISATTVRGKGFTVARSDTGKYTITLDEVYPGIISATANLQMTTPGDQFIKIGAIDVTSAKTVVLYNWDISGGAAADLAADAGTIVHFCLLLRNTNALT